MFKFNLNDLVVITASGESGYVKGRSEYTADEPRYYVHYKATDGRAVSAWIDESDLQAK